MIRSELIFKFNLSKCWEKEVRCSTYEVSIFCHRVKVWSAFLWQILFCSVYSIFCYIVCLTCTNSTVRYSVQCSCFCLGLRFEWYILLTLPSHDMINLNQEYSWNAWTRIFFLQLSSSSVAWITLLKQEKVQSFCSFFEATIIDYL